MYFSFLAIYAQRDTMKMSLLNFDGTRSQTEKIFFFGGLLCGYMIT